eukprot:TRINITY_DN251_c0_g1_i1.p1 TRINITY_DN251_c0_g1~~TRINITY_DN251_c0_g1_i1.p1  ORF type:complete len:505 (+),score=93.53 TRINITY_DN251_c0_g1_i1:119-1516(+)
MQNGESLHHQAHRHFNPQVSMIKEIPDDIDTLKSMYMQSVQEIKMLQKRLQGKDQELQMQKKSLSNLALTVVQQDKHIKSLLGHIDQLNAGGGGGSYMGGQQNSSSIPGMSDGGYSAGDVHSQSSGEDEDEYYEDVPVGGADDDEMFELKQQILNAHDFLKDLEDGGDVDTPPAAAAAEGGKRARRGSKMNSRASSPYSQKSLGMSDIASGGGFNTKPPTPPTSTRGGRGDNHRRSITNDNLYGDEENSRINRSRSIQPPRSTSRQQYSGGNPMPRMQSIDSSYQDESSSIVSRGAEDRRRGYNHAPESSRSYSKNGSATYREKGYRSRGDYGDVDSSPYQDDFSPPSARRSSYSKQYREYGGGVGGSGEFRHKGGVGRLGGRVDSGYSYSGSYGGKTTSRASREDSYQIGNRRSGSGLDDSYQISNRKSGSGLDDEFDVGVLNDKIAALENDDGGWDQNDNYLD